MRTIAIIVGAAMLTTGCLNSSTSLAYKSITYIQTPEIQEGGTIENADNMGDARIKTDVKADVPIN